MAHRFPDRREANAAAPATAASFVARHRAVLRAWLVFIGCLAALQLPLVIFDDARWEPTNVLTAHATAWALSLLGHVASADGRYVHSSLYDFEVIRECTGIYPLIIFTSAVLAYPAAWAARLGGWLAGSVFILMVNTVRLVSLCYVGAWYPAYLEPAHVLVWQSLMVLVPVGAWLVWVMRVACREPAAP